MAEIGAALILMSYFALSALFLYFGLDDGNPALTILGINLIVAMLLMIR